MKDLPILFSGPMVRAIRRAVGPKTQTRRVMKVQPPTQEAFPYNRFSLHPAVADGVKMYSLNDYSRLPKHPTKWDLCGCVGVARDAGFPMAYNSPYQVGQRLWVRETWAQAFKYDDDDKPVGDLMTYYRADGAPFGRYYDTEKDQWRDGIIWCPSIFMPRALSRITLRVTGVRAERLQDISEEDARAEGLSSITKDGNLWKYGIPDRDGMPGNDDYGWHWQEWETDPRKAFRKLWDSINGKRPGCSWDDNPWVWVNSFERVTA